MYILFADFVLCYKKQSHETEDEVDGTENLDSIKDDKKRHEAQKRHWFLKQCEKNGLELEKQHYKVCVGMGVGVGV